MKQEEKAKAYDEVVKQIKECTPDENGFITIYPQDFFPELKESEDDKIRKELIDHINNMKATTISSLREKQFESWIAWLEKQGMERKQLYIRFGDIPSNEKSKIYQGEEEIGDENGVSVYPAFELNGNIVLGLTLPITRTTLYTQQHLLEYDNRPCYLVSGDYVGKGTDGEPLIRNISIIKRLNNYRIKEFEKQGEQKTNNKVEPKFKVGDWIVHNERKHIIKVVNHTPLVYEVVNILGYHHTITNTAIENNYHLWSIADAKDGDVLAEDPIEGHPSSFVAIYKKQNEEDFDTFNSHCFIGFDGNFYEGEKGHSTENIHPATKEQLDLLFEKMKEAGYLWNGLTKRLINIKESGYEWDSKNKKYKNIEQKSANKIEPIFNVGDKIQYLKGCGTIMTIEKIENGEYIFANNMGHTTIENGNKCYLVEQKPAEWHREDEQNLNACLGYIPDEFLRRWLNDVVHAKYDKPAWSEEDEKFFKTALWHISYSISNGKGTDIHCDTTEWLKSLKERIIS